MSDAGLQIEASLDTKRVYEEFEKVDRACGELVRTMEEKFAGLNFEELGLENNIKNTNKNSESEFLQNSADANEKMYGIMVELHGKLQVLAEESVKKRRMIEAEGQKSLLETVRGFFPEWYAAGQGCMASLIEGLGALSAEFAAVIEGINAQLASISSFSGGGEAVVSVEAGSAELPAYANGGVILKEQIARVGEVPEVIIPLERLPEMVFSMLEGAMLGGNFGGENADKNSVNIEQNIVFSGKVESPSEVRRVLQETSRQLAEELI